MDISLAIELGIVAAGASILGAMLGLGGGVFIVPIFTLFLGVDEKVAIGASAVAVVFNSIIGSSNHLRSRFTNVRLVVLLLLPTATGALIGALFAVNAPERILNAIFGAVLTYAAVSMLLKRQLEHPDPSLLPDPWHLAASYYDTATGQTVHYIPQRMPLGLSVSGLAGVISGMLGVGGGVIQVPAMNLLMRVPVKAAAGTSAVMVGITAVATSFVFYAEEQIDPTVVTPALIGVMVGSQIGSRLTRRVKAQRMIWFFVIILLYLGASLILSAANIDVPGQK